MKNWPLRRKLTLWSAAVTGLALLTFGVVTAVSLYFSQLDELDGRLEAQAKFFFAELPANQPATPERLERMKALLETNGDLRGFAFGEKDQPPEYVSTGKIGSVLKYWAPHDLITVWQEAKRFVRIGGFSDGKRLLMLVASQKPAQELIAEVMGSYAVAFPLVLIVVALGSSWIAGRALQPIVAITREASAITAQHLDRRLPVPPVNDEISRHIQVLNAMLDRLQKSFEQATRFTADASHELRTPLTILRGEIEQALHETPEGFAQEKLMSLLEQTSSLQKITDNLLLLARFDAGKLPLQARRFDFSQLVTDAAEDAGMLGASAELCILPQIESGITIDGDAVLLRRALLNLVDNAVRYNRPQGEVHMSLRRNGGAAVFTIANTGDGIPVDRVGALFQRFFRASEDRNSAAGGSGLGLSLCREIVLAHGGQIVLATCDARTTEFVLRLPISV